MKTARQGAGAVALITMSLLALSAAFGAAQAARDLREEVAPPAGQPAPASLVGRYTARFTSHDEQTAGTWQLRIGPGHHLRVWNPRDGVAYSPSFEAGPVSFRGSRMIFAESTGEGVCLVGATYRWTYRAGMLRFRVVGSDGCGPRVITFTPHPWHRAS